MEIIIPLDNGCSLRCGPGKQHAHGGYLRICDDQGKELIYWDSAEWEGEGSESVIGAVFAAANSSLHELLGRGKNPRK